MASYIVNHLGQPTESHVHLFVPASLAHMIVAREKTWRGSDVLYLPRRFRQADPADQAPVDRDECRIF